VEHDEQASVETRSSSAAGPAGARAPEPLLLAAAMHDAPLLRAAGLIGLQRAAGNRAVGRLLQRTPTATGEITSDAEAVQFARQFASQVKRTSLREETRTIFRFLVRTYAPDFWQRLGKEWTFDDYPYQNFTFRIMQDRTGRELIGIGPAIFTRIVAGELQTVVSELQVALQRLLPTQISFQQALDEGARLLHPEFGLAGGTAAGPDPADGYDASEWDELDTPRGVLQAKVEPWLAMKHLVNNIVDGVEVPKAGGGKTKWSTDCFEYVILLRIYAFWRSMTKAAFNRRFTPLQLGIHARSAHLVWKATIISTKPGEAPFRWGEETSTQSTSGLSFERKKLPVGKTWKQILKDAPVGTQVVWSNKDATAKCSKNPDLSFCAYMNENATKMAQGGYAAHPFGVVDEHTIVTEMAKAVVGERIPTGYIERNIYISAVREPGD
jgi:hypothetical protein